MDFDYESPWDMPLYKVEHKLKSERFLKLYLSINNSLTSLFNLRNRKKVREIVVSRGEAESHASTDDRKVSSNWYNMLSQNSKPSRQGLVKYVEV